MKYSKMNWGTMEAVVNKLGGEEGVAKFLRGEIMIFNTNDLAELDEVILKKLASKSNTYFLICWGVLVLQAFVVGMITSPQIQSYLGESKRSISTTTKHYGPFYPTGQVEKVKGS